MLNVVTHQPHTLSMCPGTLRRPGPSACIKVSQAQLTTKLAATSSCLKARSGAREAFTKSVYVSFGHYLLTPPAISI